ncbi:MAG TPA: glycosyltransferase family 1 protein [Kineosporiaceae bacterium]|nr:glycosyltransferase family 1 protein [Kineosporiaceae bacterium]
MRIAIVTESFLPQVNGVTNSVLRICEHLALRGHDAMVIAPGSGPTSWAGVPVVRVPAVAMPGYGSHQVGCPWPGMARTLREFRPDVVHLASPTVLGAQAVMAAQRLAVPSIAVYQTDLAAYAARYRASAATRAVWRWLGWIHAQADRTLAPSQDAVQGLQQRGVPRVRLWPRGVDLDRFHPRHADPGLRRAWAPGGELVVGYIGRLAAEKQVHLLAALSDVPGIAVVVAGDGPLRPALQRQLPQVTFLGPLGGQELSAAFASLDVFVHTGPHETFCQAAQEALASGVPVVAPAAGGLLDLVTDGRNGRLYAPGSAQQLRRAVVDLVTDDARRREMGLAARASVEGRSWEAIGDAYLAHCEEILAAPERPRLQPAS